MEIPIYILLAFIAVETTYLVASQRQGATRHKGKLIFVDTSVLIDGRIISLAEAGFIPGTLAIPRSVVAELQFLADNGDSEKRERARHGLDIIKELQAIEGITTVIFSDSQRTEDGVDSRLLELAKRHKGAICTIDYNLNKVAQVENVQVLNINEVAKTLRMAYLPGEKIKLDLTQKGNDSHQAVGHLADGTMVVVENAFKYIGSTVEIEFIRSLQTAAGKMMFAKLVHTLQQKQQRVKQQPVQKKKADMPKPSQSPKDARPEQPKSKFSRNSQPRRRRTPEDSLVELANS